VGDSGVFYFGEEQIEVIDTKKENDLIIHIVKKLPKSVDVAVRAVVNAKRRHATENVHSATHLLHAALRQVLGGHVAQKGSLVQNNELRFDFSHFQKVTEEELAKIEEIVNQKIRKNIALEESRSIPIETAKAAGAMMLFGEKYGENVRMITFDPSYSRELCGGCHVSFTGKIGIFKITNESAISAGVRRIEAVTAEKAETFINTALSELNNVRTLFKNPKNVIQSVEKLQEENKELRTKVEELYALQAKLAKITLKDSVKALNGIHFIAQKVDIDSADAVKNLAFQLGNELENLFLVIATEIDNKPNIAVFIDKNLVTEKGLDAAKIVRELAKEIKGGGGGQSFFATAGGKDLEGINRALAKAEAFIK
jgi:alanyl-tRNA synthetase